MDEKTVLIPDYKGNALFFGLRNIMENPHVGLLFMIPGVDWTLRIGGRARLVDDDAMRQRFQQAAPSDRVVQLAIEVTRYCKANHEEPASRGLAPWRLQKIDERLREVTAPPTLGELATLCQLSVRQLTRGFRISRGCSIGDYVADNTVAQARRLLATDASIKAIAYSLGFASPSSFCFAFRRATQQTPSQYRQQLARLH